MPQRSTRYSKGFDVTKLVESKESIVSIDRRRGARRDNVTKPEVAKSIAKVEKREKVERRRQIDPTTCERDYSQDECEFMQAMETYKRKNGRMFPTCSEVLEVIRSLGYAKPIADPIPEVVNDSE
jgi:hypothetical protein